jgi:hypothetical protein
VGDRASAVARAIPHHIRLQLLIIGTAVGLLITGLILSPPGRASGGPGTYRWVQINCSARHRMALVKTVPACPIGGYLRVSSPRSSPKEARIGQRGSRLLSAPHGPRPPAATVAAVARGAEDAPTCLPGRAQARRRNEHLAE